MSDPYLRDLNPMRAMLLDKCILLSISSYVDGFEEQRLSYKFPKVGAPKFFISELKGLPYKLHIFKRPENGHIYIPYYEYKPATFGDLLSSGLVDKDFRRMILFNLDMIQ